MAGCDRDVSFLAGVFVSKSQGTFSKEVSDCGDGVLGVQLREGGAETSIAGSGFSTSLRE